MKTVRAILFYFWQFTYAILQNIAGLVMLAIYKSRGAKSEIFHNAVITYIDKKNFGGVSLGMFIFINKNTTGDKLHDMKIHEYGHTVRSVSLVGHALVVALILAHCILDGTLDVVLRHVLALAGSDNRTQCRVVFRFGSAGFHRNSNLFTQSCKGLCHVTPSFQFGSFSIFKRSSHWIVYFNLFFNWFLSLLPRQFPILPI